MSSSCFAEIESNRNLFGKIRFRRFDKDSQVLFITIPTRVHEGLHLNLYHHFTYQLALNNLDDDWEHFGSTTQRPGRDSSSGCGGEGGEADSSGGPGTRTMGWGTLVVEAGDSQSLNELRDDMRWWFSASDHAVKIVLLIKLDRQNDQILIERWEEVVPPPAVVTGVVTRRGAAAIAQDATPEPALQQTIIITRDDTTDPVSYSVTRGPLVLGLSQLFLRAPTPQEADITIRIQALQQYAARIWRRILS